MKISFERFGRTVTLDEVVEFLSKKVQENEPLKEANHHIAVKMGRKFIKLVHVRFGVTDSVYCFLDHEGNIYKAATFNAPAKYIRGSVFDENYSWGRALNNYGAAYLR